MYLNKANGRLKNGCYRQQYDKSQKSIIYKECDSSIFPLFDNDVSSIGYQLRVCDLTDWNDRSKWPDKNKFVGWQNGVKWLVGKLYDHSGAEINAGNPFFMLPVYLGL